jgi:hypothetical protein
VGYDVLFAEPDRTSPERIAESWSRFREGIPPVLPDLGLLPHDQVFAAAIEPGAPSFCRSRARRRARCRSRPPVWP